MNIGSYRLCEHAYIMKIAMRCCDGSVMKPEVS